MRIGPRLFKRATIRSKLRIGVAFDGSPIEEAEGFSSTRSINVAICLTSCFDIMLSATPLRTVMPRSLTTVCHHAMNLTPLEVVEIAAIPAYSRFKGS